MSSPALRGRVTPFHVMEVLKAVAARRAAGGDVVLLCVGQPSSPAPAAVLEAARSALSDDALGYTEAIGRGTLRQAIADHYGRAGLDVSADDVIVTTGSSGGFLLALLAAFDAGDEVAMARPGYPAYRNDLEALGCRVVDLPVDEGTRFQPAAQQLQRLAVPPRGVVVASPSNPTGTIIDPDALAGLSAWCQAHNAWLISDEIYHGISYGRPCVSAWTFDREHTVVVGSLSKFWSMTGWRLGWLLAPASLRRSLELLQGNLAICAPALSQAASVAAFTTDALAESDERVRGYAANREQLLRRLPDLGITKVAPPDGAFYAWCDISHLTDDSIQWCRDLLAETGVALTPGIDFDPVAGHRYVRISFCCSTEELDEGLTRIAAFLNR